MCRFSFEPSSSYGNRSVCNFNCALLLVVYTAEFTQKRLIRTPRQNIMAKPRSLKLALLYLIVSISEVCSKRTHQGHVYSKQKHKIQSSRSKIRIEKGSPWPFLPSAGNHHTEFPHYPSYPFMIVAPPRKFFNFMSVQYFLENGS